MTQYTQTDRNGDVYYYSDADCMELHRSDGPAIEYTDGDREWWLNNQLHRSDGAAIEWADGARSWLLNGNNLTFSEWLVQTPVTDAERLMLALKYSEHA